ncbi:MAG: tail fiber protein [Actinomycetia bacterium]|nr:tail fiber protein [Actinomycetes bacterium]
MSGGGSSVPLVGELGQFYECNLNGRWQAVGEFADPFGVRQPVGSVQFMLNQVSSPYGYLEANGQSFDRAVDPDLAAVMTPAAAVPNLAAQAPAGQKIYIKALG